MSLDVTRRQVLSGALLSAAVGASSQRDGALASIAATPERRSDGVLVVVFLRGGADGLSIAPPYADPAYYRLRPSLSIPGPRDLRSSATARCIDLDGRFGLHPSLRPLEHHYRDGQLAIVHAVGSGDQTRSHFEAMAVMERGLGATTDGPSGGWLARALASADARGSSPVRAMAFTDTMPDSLRGATGATVVRSLADFSLRGDGPVQAALARMYGDRPQEPGAAHVCEAGRNTLHVMDAIAALGPASYKPAAGAVYPDGPVGGGLRQSACLIKGGLGIEVACLYMDGWDTHVGQGRDTGWLPSRLDELGRSLSAFAADLGPDLDRVTSIVMTEFGRRAYENSGLGTDHGRASCMLLLGAGVAGGNVYGVWPGLAASGLEAPGDLRVTTDYRTVLAEVLEKRVAHGASASAFPGHRGVSLGVIGSR